MKKIIVGAVLVTILGLVLWILYAQGRLGCPPGYFPNYYFDGAENRFGGCLKTPNDLNKECFDDAQCEYNCVVEENSVKALGCEVKCFTETACRGVKGKCGVGEYGLHIPQADTVRPSCDM